MYDYRERSLKLPPLSPFLLGITFYKCGRRKRNERLKTPTVLHRCYISLGLYLVCCVWTSCSLHNLLQALGIKKKKSLYTALTRKTTWVCVNMCHLFSLQPFSLLFLEVFLSLLPQSLRLLPLSRLLFLFLSRAHLCCEISRFLKWVFLVLSKLQVCVSSDLLLQPLCLLLLFLESLLLGLLLLLLLPPPLLRLPLSLLLSLCPLLCLAASHLLLCQPGQTHMMTQSQRCTSCSILPLLSGDLQRCTYLACSSCSRRSSSSLSLCSRASRRFSARIRLASSGSVVPAEGLWAGGLLTLSRRHKWKFNQSLQKSANHLGCMRMRLEVIGWVGTDRWSQLVLLVSVHSEACSDPAAEAEAEEDWGPAPLRPLRPC